MISQQVLSDSLGLLLDGNGWVGNAREAEMVDVNIFLGSVRFVLYELVSLCSLFCYVATCAFFMS